MYVGKRLALVKALLKRVNETLNHAESGVGTINLQSQPEQTGF